MPTLNTSVSVVDYLKSIGQDSSLTNRKKLGTQYGIDYSKSTDLYATENTQLLKALTAGKGSASQPVEQKQVPDYSGVQSVNDANAVINRNQQNDINTGNEADEPPVRQNVSDEFTKALEVATTKGTVDTTSDLSKIAEAIKPTTEKPEAIDLTSKMNEYRTTYGIDALETQLNDLQTEADNIKATARVRTAAERDKPVATNVIEGRVSQVAREEAERLDTIQRQIENTTNQLNTKYKIIDTYMGLTKTDYDNAVKAYDTELSNNISMFNVLKGVQESEKTEQERITDNARASAQIIYNQLSSGNVKITDLTPDQQTLISKLELQSGLPVGFYKTLQDNNPKADVVSTTNWTDENNNEYVSIITKDSATGKLSTQNVLLGVAKTTGSDTTDLKLTNKQFMLDTIKGTIEQNPRKDNYLSPQEWATLRQQWTSLTPYGGSDFDDAFRGYVNPQHPQDYAGFESYTAGFKKSSNAQELIDLLRNPG